MRYELQRALWKSFVHKSWKGEDCACAAGHKDSDIMTSELFFSVMLGTGGAGVFILTEL